MVDDHLRQTGALMDALERDWHAGRAAGRVNDTQWSNWAQWLAGWRKFFQDSKGLGATLSGGYVDRSIQYRAEYEQWRKRLSSLGAKLQSPVPVRSKGSPSWARDIAVALGVIGISAVFGALLRGKFK